MSKLSQTLIRFAEIHFFLHVPGDHSRFIDFLRDRIFHPLCDILKAFDFIFRFAVQVFHGFQLFALLLEKRLIIMTKVEKIDYMVKTSF